MRRAVVGWTACLALMGGVGCGRQPATPTGPSPGAPPDGAALYRHHCAGCHGESGAGDGAAAAAFTPVPRDFTTGKFAYRSTPPGGLPCDDDLYRTVADGLRWSAMPPFGADLTPDEIRAVVSHVKHLSRRQDDDGEWHVHFEAHPQQPPLDVPPSPPLTQELLDRGAALYAEGGQFCMRCHGPEGAGDGTSADWLVDEFGAAIRPRDLRNPIYQRGATPREIYLRVKCGIPGTPMPSAGSDVPDDDIWALAHHVRSLQRMPVAFVERGRLLHRAHGCADCHGEDLFGIPNPGARKDWTTPLGTLAGRVGLRDATAAGVAVQALEAGPDWPRDHALLALPGGAQIVAALLDNRRAVIEGRDAAPAQPGGPAPAIPRMASWRGRLSEREVDAILAYCLTLELWVDAGGAGD